MKLDQKNEIREQVKQEISVILREIDELELLIEQGSSDQDTGMLSQEISSDNSNIHRAALKAALNKLYNLRNALKKVDSPDYGVCRECKQPIQFERLRIFPESNVCVRCAAEGFK